MPIPRLSDDAIRALAGPVAATLLASDLARDAGPALSDNSRTVFEKRYLRRGPDGEPVETIAEALVRVATFVAAGHLPADIGPTSVANIEYAAQSVFAAALIEDEEKRDYELDSLCHGHIDVTAIQQFHRRVAANFELVATWSFLPNSPTWTGAGTPIGQLAACFVLPLEDDLMKIMTTKMEATMIQKSGGGNGFCFSNLRPKGSYIKSSGGVSCGPISFLGSYDQHFGTIAQGGTRRGANMAVFRIDHPDIREFITCKGKEGSIANFNISVHVTDEFFTALDAGEPFALVDPHTKKVTERVDPQELWDLIVDHAWHNGEPGVLFMDTGNLENPVPQRYRLEATNPCVAGDTWVTTPTGRQQVRDIVGRKTALLLEPVQRTKFGDREAFFPTTNEGFFETGVKDVVELIFARDVLGETTELSLRLTPDHKVRMADASWRPAGELQPGDYVMVDRANSSTETSDILGYDMQLSLPRARVVSVEPAGREMVYDVQVPGPNEFVASGLRIANCGEQLLGPHENCCLGSINLAHPRFWVDGHVDWEALGEATEAATRFLDSVVSANKYVKEVPALEIAARGGRRIGLSIMGLADLMFRAKIRYGSPEGQLFAARVMSFIKFWCMSTSVALAEELGPFPWIAGSRFDFGEASKWRAPDWAPPANAEPLQKLELAPLPPADQWSTPRMPRHEDFGAAAEQPSRDAIDGSLIDQADRDTVDSLLTDQDEWASCWFRLYERMRDHGIRNMAQLTIAPTGTIATVAGCEGYGCEPVFALAYMRTMKDGDTDVLLPYGSPMFAAALTDHFTVHGWDGVPAPVPAEVAAHVDGVLRAVADRGTCQGVDSVPPEIQRVFVVTEDISPEEHVRMQAAMQGAVDNSISKTCNLANSATREDVSRVYRLAHSLGCKGLTVYRAGSRDVVVLETAATAAARAPPVDEPADTSVDKTLRASLATDDGLAPDELPDLEIMAPGGGLKKRSRPRRLTGYTYRVPTAIGTIYPTISFDEAGQPFEMFVNGAKGGTDLAADAEGFGRMIAAGLRTCPDGCQRDYLKMLAEQLRGLGGRRSHGFGPTKVHSMPDALGLAMQWFLADTATGVPVDRAASPGPPSTGTHLPRGDLCPGCGNATLVRESGCNACHLCGHSEC